MQEHRADALHGDYGLILSLLQDSTVPGHIGDHLTDALADLGALIGTASPPAVPAGVVHDPMTVIGGIRARLQVAITDARERSEMLALGRIGRHLALAERDLTGRPCPDLLATRDTAAAMAAIRR